MTVFLGPDYMTNFIPGWNFSPASKTNPLKTKLIVNYMERDSARAEKETRACALTVFSHLSKLSHGNLRFAPGLKLSM